MAQHVAAAIDAWALAIPKREHAVIFAFAANLRLLRAPDRGRGQILVEARHEQDIIVVEIGLRAVHLRVDAAERRAAIARDQTGGVEAGAAIHLLLHQQKTHDRLRSGHQRAFLAKIVFVRERRLAKGDFVVRGARETVRHSSSLLRLSASSPKAAGASRSLRHKTRRPSERSPRGFRHAVSFDGLLDLHEPIRSVQDKLATYRPAFVAPSRPARPRRGNYAIILYVGRANPFKDAYATIAARGKGYRRRPYFAPFAA